MSILTTQSVSATASGTSLPISTLGGHGSANSLSITLTMPWVRTSTDHEELDTVSYTMDLPKWHLNKDNVRGTGVFMDKRVLTLFPSHILPKHKTIIRRYMYPLQ